MRGKAGSPGDVRAVQHGIAIAAEYSLPGSPRQGRPAAAPRKWLKFKSSSSGGGKGDAELAPSVHSGVGEESEGGAGSKGGWGGIFAFRRSVDGGGGGKQ
jgi:hypothetical protein